MILKESHYCIGKVMFTHPFLILGKVTSDKPINVLERSCKGDIPYTITKPLWLSFQNQRSVKVLFRTVSPSPCDKYVFVPCLVLLELFCI